MVLDGWPDSESERRRVPAEAGTSHAVFVRPMGTEQGRPAFALRFYTTAGELPACGHGTVAALAMLASRGRDLRAMLHTVSRRFNGWASRDGGHVTAWFDPGIVRLRDASEPEWQPVAASLGLADADVTDRVRVASVGRERLLLPVPSRAALAAINPDFDRVREACDRHGLLGCYVYSPPDAAGGLAARMFAPSIGVPEDIANANSTACLAAHLYGRGVDRISVEMGDQLGSPATIMASAEAAGGAGGCSIRVGGESSVAG